MKLIHQRVYALLAMALSILSASCAAPPPVRTIPPEAVLHAKQYQYLRNVRWRANELIKSAEKTYGTSDASISDFFHNEIVALIEPLRLTLETNSAAEIESALATLEGSMEVLGFARMRVEMSTEFLSKVSGGLSPSLKAEVTKAIVAVQQAMKGESWDEARVTGGDLTRLYEHQIMRVKNFQETSSYLSQLGNKVSPELKHQYFLSVKPMRQALKGNSWDEIDRQWTLLPRLVFYPRDIVDATLKGRNMLEELQPSEQQDVLAALSALDDALRSESWDRARARAEEIDAIAQKFGGYRGFIPRAHCVRVLSIDGGGVRGIIPATILAELERRTKRPIAQLFDLIVGTSTGGILALGLTTPDPKDRSLPRHRAAELVTLYEKEGERIFPATPLKAIRGLFGPKYSPEGLEQVLKDYLGENTLLGDALTNVMIPAYAMEERHHGFFTTYADESFYIYMWEAARAASAAPTYFPPFRTPVYWGPRDNPQNTRKSHVALIDGGVFANNPAPYALSFAKRYVYDHPTDPNPKRPYDIKHPILLLSLGTGQVPPSTSFEDAWNWGLLGWAGPVIDILFSDPGIEDETRGLMSFSDSYFRLQPRTLTDSTATLDNASSDNIRELKRIADDYVRSDEIQSQLDKLVIALLRERPKECQRVVGPK
jgi:hypothetical protein